MITVIDLKKMGILVLAILILALGIGKLYGLSHNKPAGEAVVAGESIETAAESMSMDVKEKKAYEKGEDFFAEYRLERENMRSKQIEMLKGITDNEKTEKKARDAAALRVVEITREMEKELKAESLVKSKGFDDCIVILQSGGITVVVEGDTLSEKEESDIRKAVGSIAGDNEKISIIVKSEKD